VSEELFGHRYLDALAVIDLRQALREAGPEGRKRAIRRLRLRRGAAVAELDQVEQELRELERRQGPWLS